MQQNKLVNFSLFLTAIRLYFPSIRLLPLLYNFRDLCKALSSLIPPDVCQVQGQTVLYQELLHSAIPQNPCAPYPFEKLFSKRLIPLVRGSTKNCQASVLGLAGIILGLGHRSLTHLSPILTVSFNRQAVI